MDSEKRGLVLASFADRKQAEKVVNDLREAGFEAGDVGLAIPGGQAAPGGPSTVNAESGVEPGAGGVIGGVTWGGSPGGFVPGVGMVVASGVLSTLITGAMGGTEHSLFDDLVDKGVPEDEARLYDGELRAGRTIMAVRAGDRAQQVVEMLRRHGARQVEVAG